MTTQPLTDAELAGMREWLIALPLPLSHDQCRRLLDEVLRLRQAMPPPERLRTIAGWFERRASPVTRSSIADGDIFRFLHHYAAAIEAASEGVDKLVIKQEPFYIRYQIPQRHDYALEIKRYDPAE